MSYIKESRIYYINSRNRISGTDSNFNFQIEFPLGNEFDHVALMSCIIPKSYYLIQEGQHTFTLSENTQTVEIVIPIGNYNRPSLASTVETLLNNASPNGLTYTVTFPISRTEGDTGKYTFTVTNLGIYPVLTFGTYVYENLGFERNSSNHFTLNAQTNQIELVSTNVIKLQKEDAIYICSDIVNDSNNILQEVYSSTNPDFTHISFYNNNVEAYAKKLNKSGTYNFYITNEDQQPIELNGQNVVFTIILFKKQNALDLANAYIKYSLLKK